MTKSFPKMQFSIDFLGFLWSATNETPLRLCKECLITTQMITTLCLILSVLFTGGEAFGARCRVVFFRRYELLVLALFVGWPCPPHLWRGPWPTFVSGSIRRHNSSMIRRSGAGTLPRLRRPGQDLSKLTLAISSSSSSYIRNHRRLHTSRN